MSHAFAGVPAIRTLQSQDVAACDSIVLSLPYHFAHEGGRKECAHAVRTAAGLVALVDNRVVGFLTSAEITWLAVAADQRGKGVGRTLVERLCTDLQAEDRKILLVTTLSSTAYEDAVEDGYARTRSFYRSVGFIDGRELPNLWPDQQLCYLFAALLNLLVPYQ